MNSSSRSGEVHLVPFGGHGESRILAQPSRINIRHGSIARESDLTPLDGRGPRLRLADEARNDAVEVRPTGSPVIWIPVEPHVLAALPCDELEGAGAYRTVRMGIVPQVCAGKQMLRQHRRLVRGQRLEHVGRRVLQPENRGMRVGRVDRFHLLEVGWPTRMDLLEDLQNRELNIGAGERRPVVEFDAFLQLERDGFGVGADLPGLGEARQRLEVHVIFQQAVINLWRNLTDRTRRIVV